MIEVVIWVTLGLSIVLLPFAWVLGSRAGREEHDQG